VLSLVERSGVASSYHLAAVTVATVRPLVLEAVSRNSRLHTDEARICANFDWRFAQRETVEHTADEYVLRRVCSKSPLPHRRAYIPPLRGDGAARHVGIEGATIARIGESITAVTDGDASANDVLGARETATVLGRCAPS
jgi:hypothetical protein